MNLHLNTISPAANSKKKAKRLGRGIGCTLGKTCGKGHKGQKARSGGYHKIGFEGGQMPLQRRIPKFGFSSRKSLYREELRLEELNIFEDNTVVDLEKLKEFNLVSNNVKYVKVFLKGEISKSITLKGIKVTKQVKEKIEAAKGKVE